MTQSNGKRPHDGQIINETSKKIDNDVNSKVEVYFSSKIFNQDFRDELKNEVKDSQPYKWGTIRELMNDELLRNVRKEVLNEIHFTKKETDIYKVFQSGDLANLSGLNWDDLSRLPSLYKLRSAIYSQTFRDFISYVTGCGKLSGIKTDMSINTYTKSCHLLTHDDVIGSRRVSFILYLPDPDKTWKPHYGGSLRLFDSVVPNVPKTDYHCKLTPQFNQIAFFTVQPGLSFHDVEEVYVDKQRLSIQGWFHIPQEGEDGFIPGEQEETAKSTLQQLESQELQEYDFPKINRNDISKEEIKIYDELVNKDAISNKYLSTTDISYLEKFMSPNLLKTETMIQISDFFADQGFIDIKDFINPKYSTHLHKLIRDFELNELPKMPSRQSEVKFPWKQAVPPHKQRFLYIDGQHEEKIDSADDINFVNNCGPQELPNFSLVKNLINAVSNASSNASANTASDASSGDDSSSQVSSKLCELASFFKSKSFRKWLVLITQLVLIKDQILIRRFRPGHDFILATLLPKDEDEAVLDCILEATLNLTPTRGWENGEFGGYELCMITDDENGEDDDAAIYRSSENSDSVVYSSQACWNKLTLILRDPNVLKFIKYVSFNANGSRFDISGQWNAKNYSC
ncbi:hypothetical protein PACTADRAFT_50848 [Pachysolen tannophilus NRRL Y-2460]|uniref:uS12 prolyl 3,4-dihydroxylase n=1 Tax=Pachysolen tannophilus NRRL Y-2460 TaxID=669874 RepID=A0A1E4TTG9_PACTA|nr:hypothetical protein PACTADRAFT_50848 [Pachysolen tannophilus NRRL Y-2460]